MTWRSRRTRYAALVLIAAGCLAGILHTSAARSSQPIPTACSSSDCRERNPRTLIACLNHGRFEYFSRPKRCDLFGRTGPEGERIRDIATRALHWTKWGGPKAEAEGTDGVGQPLRVVPYNPRRCHGAVYYRLAEVRRLRSGRTYQLKLARCGEVRFQH